MEDTQQCPDCSAICPLTARFCVKCGRALSPDSVNPNPMPRSHTQPLDRDALDARALVMPAEVKSRPAPLSSMPRPFAPPAPSVRSSRPPVQSERPAESNGAAFPARITSAEIDKGFEELEPNFEAIAKTDAGFLDLPQDRQQVEVLFAHLAAEHLGPFRDFMFELKLGEARRDWTRICVPAVLSLLDAAKKLGLSDLAGPLEVLSVELGQAQKGRGPLVDEEARGQLLSCYHSLAKVLPEAFSVEREQGRREPIIVDSVLRQVPGVNKVQLDKIYGAGLTELKMFYDAKPEELAATTGLSLELSSLIVERFERHRRRMASVVPEAQHKTEHAQIEQLTAKLRRHNQAIEDQGRNWTRNTSKEKRKLRQARADSWLELQMLLARLGEVPLVQKLERLPFLRRAEELEKFLERRKNDSRENV